jgi:hypothetical protein
MIIMITSIQRKHIRKRNIKSTREITMIKIGAKLFNKINQVRHEGIGRE